MFEGRVLVLSSRTSTFAEQNPIIGNLFECEVSIFSSAGYGLVALARG